MCPSIHFIFVVMFFNLFVLFAAACLKTIPAEDIRTNGELDNTPLKREPVLSTLNDYSAHIKQFRQARTFPSPQPTKATSTSVASFSKNNEELAVSDLSAETLRQLNREPLRKNSLAFSVKTDTRTENQTVEGTTQSEQKTTSLRSENNNVHDDRDLFEALQVMKPDICGSCPPIWMKKTAELKDICSNHESISTFFSMALDKRDAQHVQDTSDLKECTRSIICSEPHMLVKWHESDLCDVHAPYTGTLATDNSNMFVYKCNGTQWALHGFPLTSVVCAVSST